MAIKYLGGTADDLRTFYCGFLKLPTDSRLHICATHMLELLPLLDVMARNQDINVVTSLECLLVLEQTAAGGTLIKAVIQPTRDGYEVGLPKDATFASARLVENPVYVNTPNEVVTLVWRALEEKISRD